MRPVLFHFFDFPVRSYGFMLGVSFLAGIGLGAWRARRDGLKPQAILDLGILIIIAVGLGSRLYYVLLHMEEFPGGILSAFNPFQAGGAGSGLVMYGGLLGGLLAAFAYLKMKDLSFPRYADAMAPSMALGVFLTRIGCFLNGCCYGKSWDGPLAVSFPPTSAAGQFQEQVHAAGLHPSQLYESFGGLVILVILLTAGRRWRRWDGLQLYMVILLYAVLRFMVEYTRHFEAGEMLGPFTHNQVVCLVLVVVFGFLARRSLRTGPRVATA
jgi:phosphatidylglycerol:prolipoprotein diacylglycerol transferase